MTPHEETESVSASLDRVERQSATPELAAQCLHTPPPFGLSLLPFETISGIYFLWMGSVVVYVGKSRSIRQRICQHIEDGSKSFDGMSFIRVSLPNLSKVERRYIEGLLPKYNRCRIAKSGKRLRANGHTGPLSPPSARIIPRNARRANQRWRNRHKAQAA